MNAVTPLAQLAEMSSDELLHTALSAFPNVEVPALAGLPQWVLHLLVDAVSRNYPGINVAAIPAPLAELQQWELYGLLGGEIAEPLGQTRHTLAEALAEVATFHEKRRYSHPIAKRSAGFALHDGWGAVLLYWYAGEPLPEYMREIVETAVAGGAYYEQHRDGAVHVLVGKLDPNELAPGDLPVVELEGRFVRVLVGTDPDPTEFDGAGVIPLYGGGTLRDPERIGGITRAAAIAVTYTHHEPQRTRAKLTRITNPLLTPVTTAKVDGPKALTGANLKAAYVLKGLAAGAGKELSAETVREALCGLNPELSGGSARSAVKRATDALVARGVLTKTADGWQFDGGAL